MSDDKRYIREKCGCVEVVELDARATTMVPCAAHFDADDFGHQTATSCPACDDDGGPCALCNRAFSQPVDNAAQPNPTDCTCEHIHASSRTCRSKELSRGAISESERLYPAGNAAQPDEEREAGGMTEIEAVERLRFCKDSSEMFQARVVIELEILRDDPALMGCDRDTIKDAIKLIAQFYARLAGGKQQVSLEQARVEGRKWVSTNGRSTSEIFFAYNAIDKALESLRLSDRGLT